MYQIGPLLATRDNVQCSLSFRQNTKPPLQVSDELIVDLVMQRLSLVLCIVFFIVCVDIDAFITSWQAKRTTIHRRRELTAAPHEPSVAGIQRKLTATRIIENARPSTAVIIPTFAGLLFDGIFQRIPILKKLRGIGALVTIMSASCLSSAMNCPPANDVFELCWTKLLPASLSLWLVASTVEAETRETPPKEDTWDELRAVSIPFLIGCIGSVLGCLVAFTDCYIGRNNAARGHKHFLSGRQHFFFRPGHLLLSPVEAAITAGCLCSAYIGGPWNYFTTMRILANDDSLPPYTRDAVRSVIGYAKICGMFPLALPSYA